MPSIANIAVLVVAFLHACIAVVEMFLWRRPRVYTRLERFAFTQAEADKVAPIVANAGLYNLFMASGLAWSVFAQQPRTTLFFLVCVIVAGIYGAATLKGTTLVLQTLPAALAALTVVIAAGVI